MARGTGISTRQIKAAPRGAIFVWCTPALGYPKELALKADRGDIKIVAPWFAEEGLFRGGEKTVVVDHAAKLSAAALFTINVHNSRCERMAA